MTAVHQKSLDLGCGERKRPGSIGVDIAPAGDADVACDLDRFPYPFRDSSIDAVYADNVLEHLHDVIAVMNEIHRISRPGALVRIIVPYFRARWAFIDPTHRHFFTVESFSYFDGNHPHSSLYRYSTSRFRLERLAFNEGVKRERLVAWLVRIVVAFANWKPVVYETFFSHLFPLDTITFDLRVVKEASSPRAGN